MSMINFKTWPNNDVVMTKEGVIAQEGAFSETYGLCSKLLGVPVATAGREGTISLSKNTS